MFNEWKGLVTWLESIKLLVFNEWKVLYTSINLNLHTRNINCIVSLVCLLKFSFLIILYTNLTKKTCYRFYDDDWVKFWRSFSISFIYTQEKIIFASRIMCSCSKCQLFTVFNFVKVLRFWILSSETVLFSLTLSVIGFIQYNTFCYWFYSVLTLSVISFIKFNTFCYWFY